MGPVQHVFPWAEEPQAPAAPQGEDRPFEELLPPAETNPLPDQAALREDGLPIPLPLPEAVTAAVFGQTVEGPVSPDAEEVAAITEEHANELVGLLGEIATVEDCLRDGRSPTTGKLPKHAEAKARLSDELGAELSRLKSSYADAIAVYAEAFGEEAALALDEWARKAHAGADRSRTSYDPGHPWHYYRGGDNADPLPVDAIPPNLDAGRFIESDLPKNPAKREKRIRELYDEELRRLQDDERRYQEIVERGAEALSRYDREIAHSGNDEMARATALALKFNHIALARGRIAWLEQRLPSRLGLDNRL